MIDGIDELIAFDPEFQAELEQLTDPSKSIPADEMFAQLMVRYKTIPTPPER